MTQAFAMHYVMQRQMAGAVRERQYRHGRARDQLGCRPMNVAWQAYEMSPDSGRSTIGKMARITKVKQSAPGRYENTYHRGWLGTRWIAGILEITQSLTGVCVLVWWHHRTSAERIAEFEAARVDLLCALQTAVGGDGALAATCDSARAVATAAEPDYSRVCTVWG